MVGEVWWVRCGGEVWWARCGREVWWVRCGGWQTHILEADDVGMLSIAQENLHLLLRVLGRPGPVDHLKGGGISDL